MCCPVSVICGSGCCSGCCLVTPRIAHTIPKTPVPSYQYPDTSCPIAESLLTKSLPSVLSHNSRSGTLGLSQPKARVKPFRLFRLLTRTFPRRRSDPVDDLPRCRFLRCFFNLYAPLPLWSKKKKCNANPSAVTLFSNNVLRPLRVSPH